MENHEYLIGMLDDYEASEYGTPECVKLDHRIGAYYHQRMLLDDMTIPNELLLRTFKVSIRKQGIFRTIYHLPKIIKAVYRMIKDS